jgi:hypothetical protein
MTTPEIHRTETPTEANAEAEVAAIAVGSGIVLTQAFALFPGLLPCLLLLLPFVLPVILLGIVGAVLFGIPYGIYRLINKAVRPLRSDRYSADTVLGPSLSSR